MLTYFTKKAMKFSCEKCSFGCDVKRDYDRHLLTRKHLNTYTLETKTIFCHCGKVYKHRQSLNTHKKHCPYDDATLHTYIDTPDNAITAAVCQASSETLHKDIIERLLDQNSTLIKQLACMAPGSYNNNSVNSHNKTFNLQIFLNEDCKDAMNMSDFINSVTLQLADLESVGELGYVDGISNIFLQKLNALDMYKRPIHCTDLKRYTMHIKDADQWQKDDDYRLLKQAIKRMSKKNSDLLLDWKQAHAPQNDRDQDTYLSLIIQSMGGGSHVNLGESEVKIIKRIAKGVVVDKV
jgi:hypothetical protein